MYTILYKIKLLTKDMRGGHLSLYFLMRFSSVKLLAILYAYMKDNLFIVVRLDKYLIN